MARSTPASFTHRLRQRLSGYRWQRVGVLAGVSLALSLCLVLYLFGTDHLLSRLFTAIFVSFFMLTVTFLGILPFIGWAAAHWFGQGWTGGDAPAAKRSKASLAAKRPVARRSFTI